MSQKGQKTFDEFAWVIIGAVGFVLVITMLFSARVSKPIIEPKNIELSLERGTSNTFSITIRSEDGRSMSNVTLTPSGEVRDWITFEKNSFDTGNATTLTARVDVPRTAILKIYRGSIRAETSGGSSESNLLINVVDTGAVKLDSRPISLGNFEIRYAKGSETLYARENIETNKGAFSESRESFSVSIPDSKLAIITAGNLEIVITESNQKGNLIVELNGAEIYNKKTGVGRVIIPLEKSQLNSTNIIRIRSTGPSPLLFWSKAIYKIEKFNLVVNFVDISERERTFELTGREITNFHHFLLQGRVGEYSTPLQELVVKINDQIVYIRQPPITALNHSITRDILDNKLVLRNQNAISFSFEREAYLNLKDVFIVVFFK